MREEFLNIFCLHSITILRGAIVGYGRARNEDDVGREAVVGDKRWFGSRLNFEVKLIYIKLGKKTKMPLHKADMSTKRRLLVATYTTK